MVDTCYIYYQFKTYEKYNNAIALVGNYIKVNANKPTDTLHADHKYEYSMVTHVLAKKGLEEIRFRSLFDNGYNAIEILLRPKLLVDKNNYIMPAEPIKTYGFYSVLQIICLQNKMSFGNDICSVRII